MARAVRERVSTYRLGIGQTPTLVSVYTVQVGKLTIVMIDRLGRKGFDGKCVGNDLDGPSRCPVLTRSGRTGLRVLRFRLHGIFSTGISVTHKERRKGYKVLEYRRDG